MVIAPQGITIPRALSIGRPQVIDFHETAN
jgi:hypothetical protein